MQGRVQQGNRPVLITSPNSFNNATKLPVILPITNGGSFARNIGFAVEMSGITITDIVRCDQPLVLDIAARHGRLADTLPQSILDDVIWLRSSPSLNSTYGTFGFHPQPGELPRWVDALNFGYKPRR